MGCDAPVLPEELGGEAPDVARGVVERHPDAVQRARVEGAAELGEGDLDDLRIGVLERHEESIVARLDREKDVSVRVAIASALSARRGGFGGEEAR